MDRKKLLPDNLTHEDYTEKIIRETCIADYIKNIGKQCKEQTGYDITPDLICDIYRGRDPGENSEFVFLRTFLDSELDCDKMDYLLRDSLYCGVNYGTYDVERLISSLTVYIQDDIPRLAIEYGGLHVFEEFVLARYFMFIQVYFHRTRRYLDLILTKALNELLPNGRYPVSTNEYLTWDDVKVIQLIKENASTNINCDNIHNRVIYPCILESKPHPQHGDNKYFNSQKKQLINEFGECYFIEDDSADKMPHKIPKKVEIDDERAILIFNKKTNEISTISDESLIISNLIEKINIRRLYVSKDISEKAFAFVEKIK